MEELEIFEPDIAALLKKVPKSNRPRSRRKIEFGPYVYWHRGKENHVYRIARELVDFADGQSKTEKRKDPLQQSLFWIER